MCWVATLLVGLPLVMVGSATASMATAQLGLCQFDVVHVSDRASICRALDTAGSSPVQCALTESACAVPSSTRAVRTSGSVSRAGGRQRV
mmetsp:Transcript_21235/g.51313  ORF Transcript_21235/g.51313 Transcript_21235/m.51313 type:complete len:90 (+) Transcript_21235:117-386(+)